MNNFWTFILIFEFILGNFRFLCMKIDPPPHWQKIKLLPFLGCSYCVCISDLFKLMKQTFQTFLALQVEEQAES